MAKKTIDTTENTSTQTDYKWTVKRKKEAHTEILKQWNRNEINKRKTVVVDYLPDGTALCKTIGYSKKSYTHKMPL